MLGLVMLGEGAGRRAARSELQATTSALDTADEILHTCTEYRLLTLDNDPDTR